jgi:hypothetical protein
LRINGEPTHATLLKVRPWREQWLHLPKSLAGEYEAATPGYKPGVRIKGFTPFANYMTRLSVQGFAEGSTHLSNLLVHAFTGIGPTANPMWNALIKGAGRADVPIRLGQILVKGFSDNREEMLRLFEMGAAKQKYGAGFLGVGTVLNKIDQGVRLNAASVYKGMAQQGWVPDTETGLREFVNAAAGQYNKKLQPAFIRGLRDTGIQPFATAAHTFNVRGVREMGFGPGAKGATPFSALALRADKAAGFIGFVVLGSVLQRLISGSTTPPKGTQVGNLGWVGDDKKLHQFPLARLFGYERGPRITGLLGYEEARRMGLPQQTALARAGRALEGTAISYGSGPAVQAIVKGVTGMRPGAPMVQEAPVMLPQAKDDMSPLKMQWAQNIMTAAQQANPAVDAVLSLKQGKAPYDVLQRQFSRYMPRAGMSEQTIQALPRIVESGEMKTYVDYWSSQARKLPRGERFSFIQRQLRKDGATPKQMGEAMRDFERKGTFKYQ